MIRGFVSVASVLIVFAAPAAARDECYAYEPDFSGGGNMLATVTVKKAYFDDEKDQRMKSFVVKGDVLLAHPEKDGKVCATFIGSKGNETSGYLDAKAVTLEQAKTPPVKTWMGNWTTGEWQNLTIKAGKKPGWVRVEGDAFWAMSEEAAKNGGVNLGSVAGEAPIENGTAGFTQTDDEHYVAFSDKAKDNYECAIRLRMIGNNYLAVEDSYSCGGHNVSFSGMYARGKVKPDFNP